MKLTASIEMDVAIRTASNKAYEAIKAGGHVEEVMGDALEDVAKWAALSELKKLNQRMGDEGGFNDEWVVDRIAELEGHPNPLDPGGGPG